MSRPVAKIVLEAWIILSESGSVDLVSDQSPYTIP